MAFDGRLLAGISVLRAVVESGSFVRAGEAVGLTASGVVCDTLSDLIAEGFDAAVRFVLLV